MPEWRNDMMTMIMLRSNPSEDVIGTDRLLNVRQELMPCRARCLVRFVVPGRLLPYHNCSETSLPECGDSSTCYVVLCPQSLADPHLYPAKLVVLSYLSATNRFRARHRELRCSGKALE